jgi:prophage DNA circulation protein
MTWWEEQGLTPGELGGETIYVETISDKIGRRIVAPVLPGADRRPASIDLGRTEAPWTVSAYVAGDYLPTYRRLRALFDKPGPYTFTHPWLGEYSVDLPDGLEVEQDMARGGIASLRFTAIPASEVLPFSEPVASPKDQVRLKATAAADLVESGFEKRWPGLPFLDAIELAEGWVEDMADQLDDAARRARSYAAPVDDLTDALQDLRASASSLVALPGQLASTIRGLVTSIFSFIPTATDNTADSRAARAAVLDALDVLTRWEAYPEEDRVGLRSERVEEYAAAFEALQGGLALAQAELVLRDIPLESTAEAQSITVAILAMCDKFLAAPAIDEDTEQALQDLRTAWGTFALSVNLPEVTTVVLPKDGRSALVLAMELFGDPTRGEEIAEMNDVLESSFLPGGVSLQVLTR